jgi:uncharacterized membrane protein
MQRTRTSPKPPLAAAAPSRLNGWLLGILLVSGVCFVCVTPPFQVPDEPEHFYRAFEVSEGRLVSSARDGRSGDLLPSSLQRVAAGLVDDVPYHAERKVRASAVQEAFSERLEPGVRSFVGFLTSAYSFVPYLPPALGIGIARLFSESVLVLFYAGRLSSVLVSALLLFGAMRIMPIARPLFFLLILAPMAVFEMASLSADAFTNSFCFLFVAFVLRQAFSDGHPLTPGERGLLLAFSIVLGLTKPAYVFLTGLFLLVPVARVGSAAKRVGFFAAMLASSTLPMIAWTLEIRGIYPALAHGGHIDAVRQFQGIVIHPIDFAKMAVSYYAGQAPILADQYVGKLGWVDTRLPKVFVVAFFIVLSLAAATSGCGRPEPRRGQRALLFLVLLASLAWMTMLLYILVTPYAARVINGTQGRYLIPLGPIAFLLLDNRRWCIDWSKWQREIASWAVLSQLVALASIVRRFYL